MMVKVMVKEIDKVKIFYLFIFLFTFLFMNFIPNAHAWESEFSTQVTLENSFFPHVGKFENTAQAGADLILMPEYSASWDEDRKVFSFIPYLVLSEPDEEKTHFDVREASIVAAFHFFELRLGVSKVFWGVTESQHLVDIINQSDSVLNIDGEDKLGQPMLNVTWVSDYGSLDFFILPYFRERTFSGRKGRFRGPFIIDTKNVAYEDSDKEKHIDFASRYSGTFGEVDLGLSFFKGTDREPIFSLNSSKRALLPKYIQTTQYGIDIQYLYESWIFKYEGILKRSKLREDYFAMTYGFEYSFTNIKSTGLDLGLIIEHLYDDRDSGAIFKNNTFVGSRLAFNDEKSTEILAGFIMDNKNGDLSSFRLEGARRINDNWKFEVEAFAMIDAESSNLLAAYKDDDYLKFSLSFFF